MPLGSRRNQEEPPANGRTGTSAPDAAPPAAGASPARPGGDRGTMIPARSKRSAVESFFMRLIATAGIVGISVAVAAIMGSSNDQGWIIGLVVSLISVVLAGILWSSRRL